MMSQRAKNCLSDDCRRSRVDCRAYLHMNGCGRNLLPDDHWHLPAALTLVRRFHSVADSTSSLWELLVLFFSTTWPQPQLWKSGSLKKCCWRYCPEQSGGAFEGFPAIIRGTLKRRKRRAGVVKKKINLSSEIKGAFQEANGGRSRNCSKGDGSRVGQEPRHLHFCERSSPLRVQSQRVLCAPKSSQEAIFFFFLLQPWKDVAEEAHLERWHCRRHDGENRRMIDCPPLAQCATFLPETPQCP